MHLAVQMGDAKLVALLLRAGADRDQESSKGRRPMDVARSVKPSESNTEILELLEGTEKLGVRSARMNQGRSGVE